MPGLTVSANNNLTVGALAGVADDTPVTFQLVYISREHSEVTVTAGKLRELIEEEGSAENADELFEVYSIQSHLDAERESAATTEDGGMELDEG